MKERSRIRQRKALMISGTCLAVVLVVFLCIYLSIRNSVNQVAADTICNNIYIEDVNVSGMTAEEAKQVLEEQFAEYGAETMTMIADEMKAETTLGEVGFQATNLDALIEEAVAYGKEGSVWERHRRMKNLEKEPFLLEADFTVDAKTAKATISKKISFLEKRAVAATITRENGAFVITDETSGKKIDLEKSIAVLEDYFQTEWEAGNAVTVELATVVDEPDVTREQLEQIQEALGTYSTSFASSSNRGKNITLATSFINGMVLMPGEELSVSDTMKPRTAENGYVEAGSYLKGQTVQSFGGGVCQVSTTLYNAVILAELEVTERWAHSMSVDYVKPSMDAAISEGYKDLKFKNPLDTPVYIEGTTVGGKLTFTIYGKETRAEEREVSYVSEVTSTVKATKKFVASSEEVGTLEKTASGHTGMKSKLWKVVTENGVEVSREAINTSNYQSSAATYSVGTATDYAEAKQLIVDAIETQDEAIIKEAIAQAQALIDAKEEEVATTPEE